MTSKDRLKMLWRAGIKATEGESVVAQALSNNTSFCPDLIIGVGKAASSMCLGARKVFSHNPDTLVVTKYHHTLPSLETYANVQILESGHPIPDEQSLLAGELIMSRVMGLTPGQKLLLLVSGGASTLAEVLKEGVSLESWQQLNQDMLRTGKNIAEINTRRKAASRIKGSRLLSYFPGAEVCVFAISDVQGDDIQIIGSGIGDCQSTQARASFQIVASNQIARHAVEEAAKALGFEIRHQDESLYGDVFDLANDIGRRLLTGVPGIYIWGGEPTIELPPNPGNGGRNQSLGLAIAMQIHNNDHITVLVAGTDGTDGDTDAAGALVDGQTANDGLAARSALNGADAGTYLSIKDALFVTGPTNTNVMDLAIALVE